MATALELHEDRRHGGVSVAGPDEAGLPLDAGVLEHDLLVQLHPPLKDAQQDLGCQNCR